MQVQANPRQTINGLLLQMREAGFGTRDLAEVQRCYELATRLFYGSLRGNGRPFLCHLVGSASVAVEFGARPELVCAALLHASYELGLFPDGRTGRSETHAAWLEAHAGAAVADLVDRYTRLQFSRDAVANLLGSGGDLDRDVVFLRLCDKLDDFADGASAFSHKMGPKLLPVAELCARLANRIDCPELGAALIAHAEQSDRLEWTAGFQTRPYSYRLAPTWLSYLRIWYRRRAETV